MKAVLIASIILLSISTYAKKVMIVAHRGASQNAPGNTLPAFRLAWKQGADAIEGDFHLTKDGHIVCIHDGNTKKAAHTNLIVRESRLAELRTLDVGFGHGEAFKDSVIPTISEVFSTIPAEKTIYIEIKCGTEIIPVLLEEIKKSNLKSEQVVVICFKKAVIQELKIKAPQYKAFWLCSFKRDKSGDLAPSLDSVLASLKQIKANGISSNKNNIDELFIRDIKQAGYEYHVWTIDDARVAQRFKKWGVRSITTNIPGYMRRNLVKQQDAAPDIEKPIR